MMQASFRIKLMGVVSISAAAFILLVTVNHYITQNVETQISEIQQKYVPIIELGSKFGGQVKNIQRNFQDAVAAKDVELLHKTFETKKDFLDKIETAKEIIGPAQTAALKNALDSYYNDAYDISSRLMSGETGESLVISMAKMQDKQAKLMGLIKQATTFDRDKLNQTFSAVSDALNTAEQLQLAINLACLLSVFLFSLWLSKGLINSLNKLKLGFERIGSSDFSHPITIDEHDEFADVIQQANQMGAIIEQLHKEKNEQANQLKMTNQELERSSYAVANKMRLPVQSIIGFTNTLLEDEKNELPPETKRLVIRTATAAQKMSQLIDGLVDLSRLNRAEMADEPVNLSKLSENITIDLKKSDPHRKATFEIKKDIVTKGDSKMLELALEHLWSNAWKFTSRKQETKIEMGTLFKNGRLTYFIKDNGEGFDMADKDKLFGTFQRLHSSLDYDGNGLGLVTVQRIIQRHNGTIWAEADPQRGATFFFTLG